VKSAHPQVPTRLGDSPFWLSEMSRSHILVLVLALLSVGVQADDTIGEATDLALRLADAGAGQIAQMDDQEASTTFQYMNPAAAEGVPIVMMHGMGDFATNPMGMVPIGKMIASNANAYVHSVEICSKASDLSGCATQDQRNGFLMTMDDQVDQFARVVKADPKLAQGFNAVGFSQGNTVIRGYIHRYNSPPVKSFVSMHGVMMGVAAIPKCPINVTGLGVICKSVDALAALGVYTRYVQDHLAQANYYRDPKKLETYRKDGHFLPYINNEVKGKENATYSENFKSLEKLVLVMAASDTMVKPKESEHFGFFKDGSMSELVDMRDAPWYTEDWFGLRTLDQAKKIDQFTTPGDHLRFTKDFLLSMVKKYFAKSELIQV